MRSVKDHNQDYFSHTASVLSGDAKAGVHALLDPARPNTAGKIVRESFDSPDHPTSVPICCAFDTTGSMCKVPRIFVEKLGALMDQLRNQKYVEHPHVMFAGIGDEYSDRAPLQVGQFEADNRLDESLSKIFLEGGGGGTGEESYSLALYFMARHIDMSATKRGKKGYLFILGDEMPYRRVDARTVKEVIGDDIKADIPTEDIIEEARKKFNIFWVMPSGTDHWEDKKTISQLKRHFGDHYLRLEDPSVITELLTAVIAVEEGHPMDEVCLTLTTAQQNTIRKTMEPYLRETGKGGPTTLDF